MLSSEGAVGIGGAVETLLAEAPTATSARAENTILC
jgi:hypothetical protein